MKRRIATIGAGFSGIGLGIRLKQAGFHDFTIYDKAEGVGGTWRDNTYPGAACDSPSFLYCFSFEPKTDWTRKWAEQSEILGYIEHCVAKHGLAPHLRLGTEVTRARFDARSGAWHLETSDGRQEVFDVVVSGVGQLNRPATPDLPGLARFAGPTFHSARWDADVSLAGKRVGVIGNAASAVQLVPRIADEVAHLSVFQRSANWMMPKGDYAYSAAWKERFARLPWLARLYRWSIYLTFESTFPVFRGNRFLGERTQQVALRELSKAVPDPLLRAKLTPDYPIGGKRVLISDDYYPTLQRDDVTLVTDAIAEVTEGGIVTSDGQEHPLDVLVLATGFETTGFLVPMKIEGQEGRTLERRWSEGAEAYLGLTVPGFPNFFMMYGPNTNLGHNSILFMIECQVRYILQALGALERRDLKYLELRPEPMEAYNRDIQERLRRSVWAVPERSWYKNAAGRITNNWSSSTLRYWWRTRRVDLAAYLQISP
jgi:cation diffusion facilitator CzcD-associated flavoprotein CzcO